MAQYGKLLGQRVEVEYRAGDVLLAATGKLAADSGKSIFLEDCSELKGQVKTYRWEIPYPCILSVDRSFAPEPVKAMEHSAAPDDAESEQANSRAAVLKRSPQQI
ncbi:MAG: hypothetical protein WBF06_12225 [Candidatus Acidiferrales bacterium]